MAAQGRDGRADNRRRWACRTAGSSRRWSRAGGRRSGRAPGTRASAPLRDAPACLARGCLLSEYIYIFRLPRPALAVNFTHVYDAHPKYFEYVRRRPDRAMITDAWIREVIENPVEK